MSESRPNVLVIMADQLPPHVLGAYGHPQVKTPYIDALAEQGVVFENAYTNFPLCVPARMSMLTGRLAHHIDCWDNAMELPARIPTVAHYMRAAGYDAILAGKMHFIGPDQLHGFSQRVVTDIYPSSFAWTPDWVKGERYRPTGINMRAVVDAGTCVRSLQMDYDDEVEHLGIQKIYDLARFAERPFFLTVSFTHPHSPFMTHQRHWDLYRHDEIVMPRVAPIEVEALDTMSRWLHYAHAADKHTITEEHVRTARHAYYGMCSYVDDKVGRIMSAMHETGLLDRTLVVFCSDHGEMLGERGMWYKQSFFEWSCRVPLIAHFPASFAARRIDAPVSLVDLVPTLLDLAHDGRPFETAAPLDGMSLTRLMGGARDPGAAPAEVISEYTGEGVCAPCRMIRRGPYKYVYTHGHPPMLFDLDRDPDELRDIAGQPEASAIESELHSALLAGWDPEHVNRQCLQSQKERLFIHGATDGEPNWAFRARPDDGSRYVRNASAIGTKLKARYPFVEPTPFER
ncbi:MAG: choline-sulfatase [Burkholderiaceae bacterium]